MIYSLFNIVENTSNLDKTADFFLKPLRAIVSLKSPIKIYQVGPEVTEIVREKDSLILKTAKVALALLLVIPATLIGFSLKKMALLNKEVAGKYEAIKEKLTKIHVNALIKQAAPPSDPPQIQFGLIPSETPPSDPPRLQGKAEGLIKNYAFESVDQDEIKALQPFIQNTNSKHPTLDLSTLELEQWPKHKLILGDVTYYCSDLIPMHSNKGVLCLVKIGDKVIPRIYYRSNSQISWRCLPAMGKNGFDGLGHFHKGLIESDTQLPIALDLALLSLHQETTLFAHATDLVKTEFNGNITYLGKVGLDPFAVVPEEAPKWFYKGGMHIPFPPNPKDMKMPLDLNKHPDFSHVLVEKEIEAPHYGKMTAKVFASKDKSYQFLFFEMPDGRAFLSVAENVNSLINDYGVRSQACDMSNMTAPLLEYLQQISPGYETYGENNRYESTRYENNWNYVREIEIVKLYYSEQKREIPPKLEKFPAGGSPEINNDRDFILNLASP